MPRNKAPFTYAHRKGKPILLFRYHPGRQGEMYLWQVPWYKFSK
jgi:hypothetical protein